MFEELKELILDQLDINADEIKGESKFIEDFGADSLDIIELSSAIEEKYDIKIVKEEIKKVRTVNDLILLIENKRK